MSFSSSKIFKGSLVLLLLDVLVIWVWAINSDLGPGSAMVIYIVVPIAFIINIVIGVVLFFAKRVYSPLFFVNCIVASVITYWVFTLEMSNQYKGHFDEWRFNLQDTTFRITKWNKYNEFSISYSEGPGSSTSFLDGKCEQKNDTLLLTADSVSMYIHNDKLYNFRKSKDPIQLKIYN
ncbi:hypothetical protein [Pedobacter foliorum]|uniref:hypothetical protein n=1 Tax=Pedobacter foliorum TaxID=2739058 RepID=UPI0015659C99|nr:hypothetical protein [Pedobacter foliorum]NRF37628.1 hypothetical protein [Pedobacter foliorum]